MSHVVRLMESSQQHLLIVWLCACTMLTCCMCCLISSPGHPDVWPGGLQPVRGRPGARILMPEPELSTHICPSAGGGLRRGRSAPLTPPPHPRRRELHIMPISQVSPGLRAKLGLKPTPSYWQSLCLQCCLRPDSGGCQASSHRSRSPALCRAQPCSRLVQGPVSLLRTATRMWCVP